MPLQSYSRILFKNAKGLYRLLQAQLSFIKLLHFRQTGLVSCCVVAGRNTYKRVKRVSFLETLQMESSLLVCYLEMWNRK